MRIREEVSAIAFADPGDFLELVEEGKNKGDVRGIRWDKGDTRVISGLHISETKDGDQRVNIKFHDKLAALKLLGKDAGLFEEEQKVIPQWHLHIDLRGN